MSSRKKIDLIASATRKTIQELGYDSRDPHLKDSPERIARFLRDWHQVGKDPPKLTTFPNEPVVSELVVVTDLAFYSLCAHHGVPFFGVASIGYIPHTKILGLSKFARVVDYFANRYQTQERLTSQIAEHLDQLLGPHALGVVLRGEHLCMSMRGIRKPGHATVTSSLHGACKSNAATRAEFLTLANRSTR